MRILASVAAAVHVAVIGFAAFLMAFVSVFPWENQSPQDAAADDWLLGAAPLMLGLAIAFAVAIFVQRVPIAAALAFLSTELAVDAIVLRYALSKSDHSDGTLVLAATAAAATAVVAVIAVRQNRDSLVVRASD